MSLHKLLNIRCTDPDGREYYSREVCGADKGHWLVRYSYLIQGGYEVSSFWERMTDNEMQKSQCFDKE